MRRSALFFFGLVVTAIVALGLVILSTASEANALRIHHDAYFFMKRQFVYIAAGVVVAALVALFDYHRWRDHPWLTVLFYVLVFAALCAVFVLGKKINGSYRWLDLGPVNIQPSEFAKLATVIVLSVWLDKIGWRVETFIKGAMIPALLFGVLAAPILFEPDFGSVMVVGSTGLLIMLVAGTRIMHLIFVALPGIAVVGYKLVTNANRMARIAAFFGVKIDVGAEVLDAATKRAMYQAHQALVAIANGGLGGVGLNNSMQKQYYLPEAHTDFIFAIGAEELGIGFSIAALLLFVSFFAISVYIAARASDRLGRFLVIGMTFVIFFQAIFNLGVVCEALPTKGIALPFFSYGGTNMLSAFFAVGTILSVGINSYRDKKRTHVMRVGR